jgi:hypothetical protein
MSRSVVLGRGTKRRLRPIRSKRWELLHSIRLLVLAVVITVLVMLWFESRYSS